MPTKDDLLAASELRAAAQTIQARMQESALKMSFLRAVGQIVHALERGEKVGVCRRCANHFSFVPEHWPVQAPRHCATCRAQRRQERQKALEAGLIAPENY